MANPSVINETNQHSHVRFEPSIMQLKTGAYVDAIQAVVTLDKTSNVRVNFLPPAPGEEPKAVFRRPDFPHILKQKPFRDAVLMHIETRDLIDGTPLDACSKITRAQAENLKSCGIYTLEKLADCELSQIESLGLAANRLQGIARSYLSDEASAQSELEATKKQLEEARKLLAELAKKK